MKYRYKVQPNAAVRAALAKSEKLRETWEQTDNQVRKWVNAWTMLPPDLKKEAETIVAEVLEARRSGIPQNAASN